MFCFLLQTIILSFSICQTPSICCATATIAGWRPVTNVWALSCWPTVSLPWVLEPIHALFGKTTKKGLESIKYLSFIPNSRAKPMQFDWQQKLWQRKTFIGMLEIKSSDNLNLLKKWQPASMAHWDELSKHSKARNQPKNKILLLFQ